MIGQKLAHYQITAALGAGGMGEVWRATDSKLGREVALKVLPEEFVDDPQRLDRFEREARAVASLNHPHIVTIHSVEEAEGIRFLTMELIEGRSLDKLIPEGGMELGLFFDLAVPLAEAISAAHAKSVIHRDLKPPNVMVDGDGRLKVLDFGLAKLHEVGDVSDSTELPTEALTGIGMVVGTMPYMSPEQIEGEIVDHRTDIFSLGVLLYEMAIGERPFQGKSSPALMSSILKDVPTPVVELRSDMPRHLGRIIGRCLEKKRRDRYQTARDVFNELKALQREASSATVVPPQPRIEDANLRPSPDSAGAVSTLSASGSIPRDEGFWVAVLPFKHTGGDTGLTVLAEGLSEDIATGLSRFSYLRVVSRGAAPSDAESGAASVRGESDASYVMEGSLRQAGDRLRIAVQLVEAATGAHLWAESYDRTFSPEALFDLQDELVPRIVSTVADMHGILPRRMSETVALKPADQLTPYEALLHSFGYNERFTPEALAEARSCLERAVEQSPGKADCWAMLSVMYSNEFGHWDNREPEYFDKALRAARKAVLAAPLHSLPHYALAQAHFFRREFPEARTAAERAVALNPMDGSTAAFMGLLIAYSGEWERGCELAERALDLNPNLPGLFHYTAWHDTYRKEDYRRALELALKLNTPGSFYQHAVLAMCYAQLGEMDAARKSLQDTLALKPDYGQSARQLHGKWIQPDLVEKLMDGLRKAGLEIADEDETAEAPSGDLASGEQRADEGFWVAVRPFTYTGDDADVSALGEGLTEEIVTGLSRFSYLRVMANDTSGAKARYVLEGSLRKAGTKVRLAVKLVDTTAGTHLWAENYERTFTAETLFELQDELGSQIPSTVGDPHGVLPHTMSELLRGRDPEDLTPYEAVLRAFGQGFRRTPEEHATVRACLERAVKQSPRSADAWALLAFTYVDEQSHGYNQRPDSLGRALEAAQRAVDSAPSNALAHSALAWAMYFRKELGAFRTAADRSIALNPLNSPTLAGLGALLAYAGDWERGCALVERAVELNPRHPGWYWFPLFYDAYRRGDYREAVAIAFKINLPKFFVTHEALAAAYGQLGEESAAGEALAEMLRLKPDHSQTGRERLEKWFDQELVEHMMDGLRKAGLEGSAPEPAESETRSKESSVVAIAVLPFQDMSPAKDQEYLCEGMAEEIMNALSRLDGLRVIARTSAFRFRGEHDLRKVGDALGVGVVLEGSVRRAGQRLRITAQLVDIASDSPIWSERFDREMTDVFEIQDEIAGAIVDKLHLSLDLAVPARRPTKNVKAYEALLEARHFFFQFTPEAAERALACLQEALSLEPDYPDALTEYAFYHVMMGYMFADPRVELAKARGLVERALQMDPDHGEAQAGVAIMSVVLDWDWLAAERHFRRALELAPASARVHELRGLISLLGRGRFDEALAELDRAVELDPLSALYAGNRGRVLTCARRFAEAEETCRRGLALDPGQLLAKVELIYALTFQRKFDEAVALGRKAVESYGRTKAVLNALAVSLAVAGEQDEAWRLLNDDAELGEAAYRSPLTPGLVHAACSEMDAAIECVGQAIDEKDPMLMYLQVHPMFDGLRDDPRYPELLRRVNLEGDQP